MWPAILAAVGVGLNLFQMYASRKAMETNIELEKRASQMRAEDRRQALLENLANQRVMAVAQGSVPDVGNLVRLRDISLQNFMKDSERDAFQVGANIYAQRTGYLNQAISSLAGSASLIGSAAMHYRNTGTVPGKSTLGAGVPTSYTKLAGADRMR